MTRQIQSPTRLLAVLAGIVGLVYLLLVGFTGNSTASASTPAPGSSCAHPWRVNILVKDGLATDAAAGYGNSTHYLKFHWTFQADHPGVTDTFTAGPKSVPGVKVRLCKFVGVLEGGRAASLTCTHSGATTRGWNVTSSRSTTCTVVIAYTSGRPNATIRAIYLTGARA